MTADGPQCFAASGAVLAIEISTALGKLAVVRSGELVFSTEFASQRSHNAQLFAPLADALAAAGDDLAGIVVGTGPGSYTGVRIAIAAAQGVGLSRGVPVIGLSSALVPEDAGTGDAFGFVGDARRNSFYAARIENGTFAEPVHVLLPDEFRAWLEANRDVPVVTYEKPVADVGFARLSAPSAELLASHAQRLTRAAIDQLTAIPLEPFYVRDAFITTPKRPWLQV